MRAIHTKYTLFLFLTLVAFNHSVPVLAQAPAMPLVDARLAVLCTVYEERISLDDFLRLVSKQTGISLSMEAQNPMAGEALCIAITNRPLREIMEGLKGLFSYKQALWEWRKTGDSASPAYIFVPSNGARDLPAQLASWVQIALERQWNVLKMARTMPPAEQAKLNDSSGIIPRLPLIEGVLMDVNLFAETLNEVQQLRVLRGEEQFRIPINQLSLKIRELLPKPPQTEGDNEAPPPIEWLGFRRNSLQMVETPSIHIEFGDKSGYNSFGFIGGIDFAHAFKKYLYERWITKQDKTEYALDASAIPTSPLTDTLQKVTLGTRLIELAQASNILLLARLSAKPSDSVPGTPSGRNFRAYVDEIARQNALISKWRAGALLISSSKWHLPEERAMIVPPETVRELRRREAKGGRAFHPADFVYATRQLTPIQLNTLAYEWQVFKQIARYYPIFSLIGSNATTEQLGLSEEGLPLDATSILWLRANRECQRIIQGTIPKSLRIRPMKTDKNFPQGATALNIELQDSEGKWQSVGAFYHTPKMLGSPPPHK